MSICWREHGKKVVTVRPKAELLQKFRQLYFLRAYDRIKNVIGWKMSREPELENGVMQNERIGNGDH